MEKKDYYEILGIPKTATDAEIKSAFRKLAKKYHPDVSKEPDAEAKFKEAQEAYAILSDPSKRQQYDQFGHQAFNGAGQGGFGGFDASGFDFSDIFGEMFGGGFGGGFGGSSSRARKGRDSIMRVNLKFEEAVFGCTKKVSIDTEEKCSECHGAGGHNESTCKTCRGSGQVTSEQKTMFGTFMTKSTCQACKGKGKSYETTCRKCSGSGKVRVTVTKEVKVPAGVDTGNQLRISGVGESGTNGGPNGDVYIEFTVKEHPIYKRDENDIYLELPITITDAILGCKRQVPTLYGTVKLSIPAGSESGEKHRLRGKGVQSVNGFGKGDMYVVINVITPTKLTREQKKLIDELSKTHLETDSRFDTIEEYI
ncbi:MAG: molecular chaperone DnaJ [Bacilli bacterium]